MNWLASLVSAVSLAGRIKRHERQKRRGTHMKRRLQFSVTRLLVATTVAAVAVHWYALLRRAEVAREAFLAAVADYGAGQGGYFDAISALRRCRDAELALPFANETDIVRSFNNWSVYISTVHRSLSDSGASRSCMRRDEDDVVAELGGDPSDTRVVD